MCGESSSRHNALRRETKAIREKMVVVGKQVSVTTSNQNLPAVKVCETNIELLGSFQEIQTPLVRTNELHEENPCVLKGAGAFHGPRQTMKS